MTKIVTITLNPSLDETLITRHLNIGYQNYVSASKHLDASGRGVNVSRALDQLNSPTQAVIMLGSDAIGHAYKGLIVEEAFPMNLIRHTGPTRSDTIIVDEGDASETHIVDEATIASSQDVQSVNEALNDIIQPGDVIVVAGSLPNNTPADIYPTLIQTAHRLGATVVLMTNGEPLKQTIPAAPELVILMQRDAEALFNYPVRTLPDIIACARSLREYGCKQLLGIMDDYSSIVLVDEQNTWLTELGALEVSGTNSGVVDALVAGYLSRQLTGDDYNTSLRLGAAALVYAANQIGNVFGTVEQLNQELENVLVQHNSAENQSQQST